MTLATGIEVRLIDRKTLGDRPEDLLVARFACGREPLHAMLVGAPLKAQEFSDAAIEFANRIGVKDFFFEREPLPFPAPFAAATQIAFAVERDHCGVFKGRREPGRRRVGRVVVDGDHSRFREHAERDRERRTRRQRPRQSYVVYIFRPDACDAETRLDGCRGEPPRLRASRQLRFFDCGRYAVVLQYGGGRVAEYSADSEDIQLAFPRFSILAQVSLRATVRLKTGLPGVVSGSTQK